MTKAVESGIKRNGNVWPVTVFGCSPACWACGTATGFSEALQGARGKGQTLSYQEPSGRDFAALWRFSKGHA